MLLLGVAACSAPERPPAPGPERATAPAAVEPSPEPVPPAAIATLPAVGLVPQVSVPPDAIYVCVVDKPGGREQTVVEFAPKVQALCKRHPEMGPCQYGRNQCRSGGGRVFASGGQEITLAHEAEYDKKVMRVRLRAN